MKTFAKRFASLLMMLTLTIGLSVTAMAAVICPNCDESCTYDVEYEQWTDDYHTIRGWCSECGEDIYQGTNAGTHKMSGGECTLCGYSEICYHDYTDIDWYGCEWEEYCEDCGEVLDYGTEHGSTYTEWDDCDWYEYCRDCDELLDEGTEHGDYAYDDWEYYTSSKHRRYYYCEICGGDDGYDTEYHDTDFEYSAYDSAQHEIIEYCYDCDSELDSYYEDHSLSYGSWSNYSGSQHRRSVYCSDCGYSSYEYANHSLSYGAWISSGSSQHQRTVSCSCGYSTTETANHNLTYGSWTNHSASQHKRTISCSGCSYSTTEYASHSLTGGTWTNYSDTEHKRTVSCSGCSYSDTEYADHSITTGDWTSISDTKHSRTGSCSCGYSGTETEEHDLSYGEWESYSDTEHSREISCECGYESIETAPHSDSDDDGYCDNCEYLTSHFSVTVPAYLLLTVSEHGTVYAAADAEIINNSTAAVEVTSLTLTAENGWSIVPYGSDMADEKVDSMLIGFTVNNAETETYGYSEQLSVYDWQIASNSSLPLVYSANVSAVSEPVEEQVLTIVFVLDWAE